MTPHQLTTVRMLRECQSRSAREQQILSGRDWLLVTVFVQLLTALYPIYTWVSAMLLEGGNYAAYKDSMLTALGMIAVCAVLLLLWGWAKYAPFRAACAALAFYLLLQAALMIANPNFVLERLVSIVLVFLGLIIAVRVGYRRRHSG